MTDGERDVPVEEDRLIVDLAGHPGFEALRGRFERKRLLAERYAVRQWFGREEPLDQRKVDAVRHYWRGVDAVLGDVEAARKRITEGARVA